MSFTAGCDEHRVDIFQNIEMKPELEMQDVCNNSRGTPNHNGVLGKCTARFQGVVMGGLETFFYKYGKFVARYDIIVTKQVLYHY